MSACMQGTKILILQVTMQEEGPTVRISVFALTNDSYRKFPKLEFSISYAYIYRVTQLRL